jgi:hypothetical protein
LGLIGVVIVVSFIVLILRDTYRGRQVCSAGTYNVGGPCVDCVAGTFSAEIDATECKLCSPGYISEPKASLCSACPSGKFAASPGSTSCQSCPRGSYATTQSASACLQCAAGKFAQSVEAIACEDCPAGTYSNKPGKLLFYRCAFVLRFSG